MPKVENKIIEVFTPEQVKAMLLACGQEYNDHTYAMSHLNAGGDIYRLSWLMGHTSVKITEIYLRAVSNRSARQGISVLDAM